LGSHDLQVDLLERVTQNRVSGERATTAAQPDQPRPSPQKGRSMSRNRRWFGAVTADIALDPKIKPTAKAVYLVLVCYADQDGLCYPGIDTLSKHLGLTRRPVQDALRQLEEHGVLVTKSRFEDGRQTSNLYHLRDTNALREPGRSR
jgi:hypothetical protein